MQYLKNMFSKPSVLWNVGEQFTMFAFIILGLLLILGVLWLGVFILEIIERHRKNKK